MKTKTTYYLLILLLLGIIFVLIWEDQKQNKVCDSHKSNSIILVEKPLIKTLKQKDDFLFVLEHPNYGKKQYKANSLLINFFNEVNPICSNVVYKINPDYFKDAYCFKTEKYNICRGNLLQKGYPVAIQKNDHYLENMYLLNSYPWKSIEEKIEELKKDADNINHYKFFIDSQIWKLPENSYISEFKIRYNNQDYVLLKKKNDWILNQKAISPGIAMKFSNEIVMLEQEIYFKEAPQKKDLSPIVEIAFRLDFQDWKYSLFEKKNYQFIIYQTKIEPTEYLIEIENQLIYLKKENYERFLNALDNLIKQLSSNQQ
jgi:hypothetical protein